MIKNNKKITRNPYKPVAMRITEITIETEDQEIKSFKLAFEQTDEKELFFSSYLPGQFCQLSLFGKGEAPFGVASAACEGDFVRFTIKKLGLFTRAIHEMKTGDSIGMRGAFGNHYPIEDWKRYNVFLIGGGYAFTTLYALTKHLLSNALRSQYGNLTVVLGARNSGLFLYKPDLDTWHKCQDITLHQAIDCPEEGWCHLTGYVPDVVKRLAHPAKNTVAFVCGPPVMINFTLPVLCDLGFPEERIYMSLERRMKCGIGMCGRCNIDYQYVCMDGPIFSLKQLKKLHYDL